MKFPPPRAGQQVVQLFSRKRPQPCRLKYQLFLPQAYDANLRRRWPLIFFLHGSGERGSDPKLVCIHGPPKIVLEQPDFPFIVVSPQCPANRLWNADSLLALLDDVQRKHRVDRRRVYLTGMSMGGYGAWAMALAAPGRFAALAPVCGGGDVLPVFLAHSARERALRTLPVWAFHGGRDDLVPPSESERMVQAMREAGAKEARLTIYPEAGHDSWTETYNNPKLYEWFLSHQRK